MKSEDEDKPMGSEDEDDVAVLSEANQSDHPTVLYASGEESVEQLAGRAERLGVNPNNLMVFSATRLEAILAAVVQAKP